MDAGLRPFARNTPIWETISAFVHVALTRAKEKLILIGTVKDANKEMEKWLDAREHSEWLLPDHIRAGASCYLDWIAPALYRHRDSEMLLELGQGNIPGEIYAI